MNSTHLLSSVGDTLSTFPYIISLEDYLPIMPLAFLAAVVLIVYYSIRFKMKLYSMRHAERMLALERGLPIPSRMAQEKQRNPYKWPIILIALGIAFIIAQIVDRDDSWAWGLLPLLIGVGMLISNRHFEKQRQAEIERLESHAQTKSLKDNPPN
ncbi:MAG: hypothetical protein FJY65_01615 [Calditrichaeota bacterium]|nr:hypothetical protein [Calditrichota bacterium]